MNPLKNLVAALLLPVAVCVNAQCPDKPVVKSVGGNCVSASSHWVESERTPAKIEWKSREGKTFSVQQASLKTNASTVAGGNGQGAGANQFSRPDRFFIDKDGALYVPDLDNNRIQKWLPGATAGITVAGGKGAGSASNQFNTPTSVFVDANGNIYVTDQQNYRVQKWAPGATSGITVAGGGTKGSLSSATSVFVDKNDNIYVSDQADGSVKLWKAGSNNPIVLLQGLYAPTGIFVDDAGDIYVCETENNRVLKYSSGKTTIVIPDKGYGSAANQLYYPLDVCVDCAGNVYVADYSNNRIQKWVPGATSGVTVAGGNGGGNAANQLRNPIGLRLDEAGNIYVSDHLNHRIQKFSNDINRAFYPSEPGRYAASVSFDCCGSFTLDSITVLPNLTPDIVIKADTLKVCPGGSPVTFTATIKEGGSLPAFRWSKNGTAAGENKAVYSASLLKEGEEVYCTLLSSEECVTAASVISNKINVSAHKFAPVRLEPDFTVCPGVSKKISAEGDIRVYRWQDGSSKNNIIAKQEGKYYVDAWDACKVFSTDTVIVRNYKLAVDFLRNDTTICVYDTLHLTANRSFNKYRWNNGSGNPILIAKKAGFFKLTTIDENGCQTADSVTIQTQQCPPKGIYMPTGFTPNADGKNDLLKPSFWGKITNYHFAIYNRTGQCVFESKRVGEGWNGLIRGEAGNSETFVWMCKYELDGSPLQVAKGTVVLLRQHQYR